MSKPRSIFLLKEARMRRIYNEAGVAEIQALTNNDGRVYEADEVLAAPEAFEDVEILFSGWGAPRMDEALLAALPRVKAIFYGAGSVRGVVSDAFWKRNILLTSSYKANAVPVAEYTVASVIFAMKNAWQFNRRLVNGEEGIDITQVPGAYHGSKVGIISLGAIGQLTCQKLTNLDVDVLAYDPFAADTVFESCHAKRADSLEQLFSECEVVSLHAPWLPQTEGLITGDLLRRMMPGATFINTARGAIVNESEMIEVLQERSDLFAVIDVIQRESTYHSSPLTRMPNVFLTPHIAGSNGRECHRMGALAIQECRHYLEGKAPITPVTEASIAMMA